MPVTSRRSLLVLLAIIAPMAACGDGKETPEPAGAAVDAVPVLLPIQQEIASVNAEVTLPGVWKSAYWLLDHPDTTLGSFRAIEFLYLGDSTQKVPSRLLMVIRAFKKTTWEKVAARRPPVAIKLAEHGDDIYAYSIVTSNPYSAKSSAALRVDAMMLALIAPGAPFMITFK